MDNKEVQETLKEHGERIDTLEKQFIKADTQIDNLCDKLEHLVGSLETWSKNITTAFITGAITGIVALIIFLIEKHL